MPPSVVRTTSFVSRTVDHIGDLLLQRSKSVEIDEEQNASSGIRRRGRRSNVTDLIVPVMSTSSSDAQDEKQLASNKLGTFSGVWVPTTLNILSILMFLRFGFILGQAGIVGMLGLLIVSYVIDLITTLSVSAISSNGTVRGGGAYYLISRSLGPEFGGSIGLVFYLGFVFNTGMNAVGLVDCIINNFGQQSGTMAHVFSESFWMKYLYATVILVLCTIICLLGSAIFSRASSLLLGILLVSTFSIPISALVKAPFTNEDQGITYTGLSLRTLRENLMPHFTKGAAGSTAPEKENWQNLFGILFPATAGIFAGASMSGDLKNPSRSIPSGTLNGLLFTFLTYILVILSMGASISRETLYSDVNVIQDINLSPYLILMGEFATSFFSALMGVIGSAKSLQALARDNIFPGLSRFGQGTRLHDEPTVAIIFTFLLAQLTLLADINTIASVVTMTYLITFWVTNLACFLLKIGSAPNFRPTFRFFTWWTAAAGAVISFVTMFFVDGFYASGVVGFMLSLFLVVHYTTPPKSWGDVSQSLIYHQVRKYLLRLRQEHVKFWRPQILLFVNDPRRSRKLIQFCNSMKKGGLYILGHIIVTTDFQGSFEEAKRQQSSWLKYIDFTHIKAFPHVTMSPSIEWGARDIVLSAGLGGLRPNIAVLGFFNLDEFRSSQSLVDIPVHSSVDRQVPLQKVTRDDANEQLPTDTMRNERSVAAQSYVNILEDLLLCLQMNVAIARGFQDLELPKGHDVEKHYIDLWPIQMATDIHSDGTKGNASTTNFDTYTLILQLGCILNTVPAWKKSYRLRVVVFVEFKADVEEERQRVNKLLSNLRIQAEILVIWLACGRLQSYDTIVRGVESPANLEVNRLLRNEAWWEELKTTRMGNQRAGINTTNTDIAQLVADTTWPSSSYLQQGRSEMHPTLHRLKRLLRGSGRRQSLPRSARPGVPFPMSPRAQRLSLDLSSESDSENVLSSDGESEDEASALFVGRGRSYGTNESRVEAPTSPHGPPSNQGTTTSAGQESQSLLTPQNCGPPLLPSRPSSPHFSCTAIPETQVLADDGGAGPTIRFADEVANATITPQTARSQSGSPQTPPLSFNDVPARGQHIILNELIRKHSHNTAVIFTTLPSPTPGACKSEQESLDYLLDLEILTANLPPVLLVHSNSLTVTTSL